MIVVLDTNVIISAVLSPGGIPAKIIRRWELDEFELAISPNLIDELERALIYDRVQKYLNLSTDELNTFLGRLRSTPFFVNPQVTLDVVKEDPNDNRCLECALASEAAHIITGDKHLLELEAYEGIQILTPAGFLDS